MVSRGVLVMSCHGLVWLAAALALWAVGASGATRHGYDTATPHAPPYVRRKFIPLHPNFDPYEPTLTDEPAPAPSRLAPSELILTALRTALDVVRRMNAKKQLTSRNSVKTAAVNETSAALHHKSNETRENARGFYDEYDEHHYHETTTTTTAKPKPRYTDPWAGYYDWIINEGSFKFWSVFQLFTAALLLYACFSAIYYAKFNPILPDYDREYDDYFLERTVGRQARSLEPAELPSGLSWINPRTFQFILDAIATHYQQE